jgi:hypothetical protein
VANNYFSFQNFSYFFQSLICRNRTILLFKHIRFNTADKSSKISNLTVWLDKLIIHYVTIVVHNWYSSKSTLIMIYTNHFAINCNYWSFTTVWAIRSKNLVWNRARFLFIKSLSFSLFYNFLRLFQDLIQ